MMGIETKVAIFCFPTSGVCRERKVGCPPVYYAGPGGRIKIGMTYGTIQ